MRLTQGAFSHLPDLTGDEIKAQVRYCQDQGWALAVEYTDDPHPRNVYWEMWGLPNFDPVDPAAIVAEIARCREAFPDHYVRITAYDPRHGRQTTALDFIVARPRHEPGFALQRQESGDRRIRYTLRTYAADRPHGQRYHNGA